ncbi:FdhF/YdeP family oxidoreductase [Paraburkholderia terricola]|uniref:Molybdopterin-dependent oxidoreductase alpha subunit n=1 Tax=Paraburkholderia terricola TaxID=169427 RepID=A0ABU1LIV6_9BURK|nr:FdhF/YdeP family oxidoreductase [Paraburkholderia terricola]MDR6406671.1 molybdopterin-dependent oxidoreductase alpha subunit [Paraburkholderia terricola]MDR6479649.1 molybdopterin-dependent oxidoreductase alpha subunit [Paraburkholderia terricola]
MSRKKTVRIYSEPAGGWGALKATGEALALQGVPISGAKTLLHMNQPEGFDCPGCAWPDPKHTSSFEFCENGAKAVAWEATAKRCTPEFFAAHSVTELSAWDDYDLEMAGRLTHPMVYDEATDRYLPIAWDDAFALIAKHLRALGHPDQADFYTSGRASNEAAFLYQLFVREFGTNNFPDCSNMCHEATSVGLPQSIGVGKGTVLLEDFEQADAIFIFGQNPGTNSPRMMSDLHAASRRGAMIGSFNPFRERALERFAAPQDPLEMATLGSTRISAFLYQVRVGGDVAVLKGMMKALVEADDAALATNRPRVLDIEFIENHTHGIAALLDDLRGTSWDAIEHQSGLARDDIENAAQVYMNAKNAILVYGMGLTQHHRGTENVQQMANLALLRGNIGRPGAGICPVRGHSNVQGNRTVGITEKTTDALLDGIERTFGFRAPAAHGHDVLGAIDAMMRGDAKVFVALGGNFAAAVPDWVRVQAAMRKLELTVQISTKLNRSHLVHGREALILPCLGRTEIDVQAEGPQSITVEDSMSMVHASAGRNPPASAHLRSEPAIVAGIARATLGDTSRVPWEHLVANYDRIRDAIERVFPIFRAYNERIRVPGGFHLASTARERVWATPTGRANFIVFKGLDEDPYHDDPDALWLTTMRSHDQYNTTLYSHSDRYRGIFGQRDVVFMNRRELQKRNLHPGERVDMVGLSTDGIERVIRSFKVVEYSLPDGCCGAYYPEANPLVPLHAFDPQSRTPSYKSVPVKVVRAAAVGPGCAARATARAGALAR